MKKLTISKYIWILTLTMFINGKINASKKPISIDFPRNGQIELTLSNTNPNMLYVENDKIISFESSGENFGFAKNTEDGAIIFSINQNKKFTFYVITENNEAISIIAKPIESQGISYRLLAEEPKIKNNKKESWKKGIAYETILVEIQKSLVNDLIPLGFKEASTKIKPNIFLPSQLSYSVKKRYIDSEYQLYQLEVTNKKNVPFDYDANIENLFISKSIRAITVIPNTNKILPNETITVFLVSDTK